jgi:hypothetical protein
MMIEILKQITLATALICPLALKVCGQVRPTIQLDTVHGMIPESRLYHLRHKILLWNDYKGAVNVLFSDNRQNWDTISVNSNEGAEFLQRQKYAKLDINGMNNYQEYLLSENSAYVFYWDNKHREWLIKLYRQTKDEK